MLFRIDCYFQLGADAVRRCDQHRIAVAGSFRVEQPAKPAEPANDAGTIRRLRKRFDSFDKIYTGLYIDA